MILSVRSPNDSIIVYIQRSLFTFTALHATHNARDVTSVTDNASYADRGITIFLKLACFDSDD